MICSLVIPRACASRKDWALDDKRSTKLQNLYSFLHKVIPFKIFLGFELLHFSTEIRSKNFQNPSVSILIYHWPDNIVRFYLFIFTGSIPIKIENNELLIGHDGSKIQVRAMAYITSKIVNGGLLTNCSQFMPTTVCSAKVSCKKLPGLLELTDTHLQWTQDGKKAPSIRVAYAEAAC